ncbi:MAG: hypothetical protein JF630_07740 [Geodermatophilales bacterium]|nr:hypothetical protein [Geodermatophilales bacterium]
MLAARHEELGESIVRLLLEVWDGPAGPAGLVLVRSAIGNQWTAKLLREFLVSQVLRRVMGTLDLSPAEREARWSPASCSAW